jgi:rhodanese-related sulfurtransferase
MLSPYAEITPKETTERIASGASLVDVREQDEWDAGRAPGSIHIPMSQFRARVGDLPDGELAIICRTGSRSANVVLTLRAAGIDARNVAGGLVGWVRSGLPIGPDASSRIL